ncbi:MAG: BON domain-containing protein [Gemmatimonadota bacterium]|nr:BON domain-containing protein [Gemmatimonadota bacterium]
MNEELTRHGAIDASDIEVKVKEGEVTLTGHVDSRRAKRLAEEIVENLSGVREVHNQLRVRKHGEQGADGFARSGSSSGSGSAGAGSSGSTSGESGSRSKREGGSSQAGQNM